MDAVGARLREDGSDEVGEARVLGEWLSGFSGFWAESLNHGILNGLVLLGKFTGLSPIFHGKITLVSCKMSLKPIQSDTRPGKQT